MVDNVSQATLKVNVEGEDKVLALNAALASLGKTSKVAATRSAADIRRIGVGAVGREFPRRAGEGQKTAAIAASGRILAMQTAKRAQAATAEVAAGAIKGVAQGVAKSAAAQTVDVTAAAAKQLAQGAPAARRSIAASLSSLFGSVGTNIASSLRSVLGVARTFGSGMLTFIGAGLRGALGAIRSFGSTIGPLVGRAFIGVARVTVQSIGALGRGIAGAGLGIARFGGSLIRMTGIVGLITGAFAGLVSVGALAAAGIKTLTFSIQAAKDEAEAAFKVFSRARRLRTDWGNAENLQEVGKILFRDAAEKVEDGINRMREKVRLGKSEEGDKQVFSRLGITAKTLSRFEKEIGKADGTGPRNATAVDFVERFVKRLETQQAKIDKMPQGRARDAALGRQRQFFLDLEKVFGDDFADAVARSSSEGIKQAFQTQAVAGAAGPEADAKTRLKQAQDLILAQSALDRTFGELKSRIAVDVQPAVTGLVWAFTNLVQAIGPNIADSMSDLAKRGIGSLTEQLNKLDAKQIESWGKALFDTAAQAGAALPSVVDSLNTFVDAIKTIADTIKSIAGFLSGDATPEGKKPTAVTEDPLKWFRNTLEKGLENSTGATSANVQKQLPELNFSLEEGAQRIKESSQSIIEAGSYAKQRLEQVQFTEAASAAGAAMAAAFRAGIAGVTIAPPNWLGQLRVSMPGGAVGPQKVTAFPPSTGRDAP